MGLVYVYVRLYIYFLVTVPPNSSTVGVTSRISSERPLSEMSTASCVALSEISTASCVATGKSTPERTSIGGTTAGPSEVTSVMTGEMTITVPDSEKTTGERKSTFTSPADQRPKSSVEIAPEATIEIPSERTTPQQRTEATTSAGNYAFISFHNL